MRTASEIFSTKEHCTDITEAEIKSYLSKIQSDVKNGNYKISTINEKNNTFINASNYIVSTLKIKNVLLRLTSKNFCWYQKGESKDDLLFVFRHEGSFTKLLKGNPEQEILILYIKTNKREKRTLVLSFHKSDDPKELKTLF